MSKWQNVEKVIKKYKIPSKSNPNENHIVEEKVNGRYSCDCIGFDMNRSCRHIRILKTWKNNVKGNPEKCFYSKSPEQLEEHHLLRAADRPYSLTVWLSHWVHKIATEEKEFEKHLINLWNMSQIKPSKIEFEAFIINVGINWNSEDKSLRIDLLTPDLDEASKVQKLDPQDLVWIRAEEKIGDIEVKFKAMPKKYIKTTKLGHDKAKMKFDIAAGEIPMASLLCTESKPPKIKVEYKK